MQAIVAKVLNEKPTPLRTLRDTVPAGVEHAVLTALAKLPADRFATAAEFATALSSSVTERAGTRTDAPVQRDVGETASRRARAGCRGRERARGVGLAARRRRRAAR